MKPTDEQKTILKATGRVVRINARAGTGKTTTLSMLANKYRNKRILYLVFNRKAMEEAQKSFPPHADVFTVHAFAFRREGYKWKDSLGHFSPADMLFAFKQEEQVLATISHSFLTFFLNSPFGRLEDAVKPFSGYLPDNMREVFQDDQKRIVQAARAIATDWNTGKRSCPHDFYLKLFHKSHKFHEELARYDIVLVDEGQDLSPVMVDALQTCKQRLFLVGDSHQQIYSFRYAIDAMQKLPCDQEFNLTCSFRFGDTIAELATVFIQEAKQERQFQIHGNRKKSSQVALYHQIQTAPKKKRIAVLSRTNLALFENAMDLRSRGKAFYFEKDIYPLLLKTLDVFWLARNRKDKIRDPLIKSFKTIYDLEDYAEETSNFQLQGMVAIVAKYEDEFPDVIFEMAAFSKDRGQTEPQEGSILSTIHSAKGQEYEQVYIDADMAENLDVIIRNELEHVTDEVNVAYVGFTRAIKQLYLPPEFQVLLTPKWKTLLESYQKPVKGKTQAKHKHKFCPNDYVQTSCGPGVILEISGEYCLIDLKHQDTLLRERLSNLR